MNSNTLAHTPNSAICEQVTPADKISTWWRYAVAVLCILVAFGIRYSLTPVLGEELPFKRFIAAGVVVAWYGGGNCGDASGVLHPTARGTGPLTGGHGVNRF